MSIAAHGQLLRALEPFAISTLYWHAKVTLNLLQVQENVGDLSNFVLQDCAIRPWLLGFEINFVNGLAELEEGLILDPS